MAILRCLPTRKERFTLQERKKVELSLTQKRKITSIARLLGRCHGAVCYEIKSNGCADGVYRAKEAHKRAVLRRSKSRQRDTRISGEESLKDRIVSCLKKRHSPEQIAGRLRYEGVERISHVTIYRFIYKEVEKGEDLAKYLLTGRGKRIKRRKKENKRNNFKLYDNLPVGAPMSNLWEADTITFLKSFQCVSVFVSCETYLVRLELMEERSPEEMLKSFEALLTEFTKENIEAISFDHGEESWCRRTIRHKYEIDAILCRGPWEKGLVENTNKLLRGFLSYFMRAEELTREYIKEVEDFLNDRPRKLLGWQTPAEFAGQYLVTPQI